MSYSKKRIILVGAVPPTIGGIAIHVERLAGMLVRDGFQVEVWDFYTSTKSGPSLLECRVVRGAKFLLFIKLLFDLSVNGSGIVHFHLSAGRLMPFLIPFLLLKSKTMLFATVHSGSFVNEARAQGAFKRILNAWVLRHLDRVVCVNSDTSRYIIDEMRCRTGQVCTIIPYMPSYSLAAKESRGGPPKTLLASGYGTPLYDWRTYLNACALRGDFEEFRFVFYNKYDEPYYSEILGEGKRLLGAAFKVYNDLTPREFSEVLQDSDIFIRPTLTDGDSIAVREALALGKIVVASDAVQRPSSCYLFKTGDSNSLAEVIKFAAGDKCRQSLDQVLPDGREALRILYSVLH